jgi:hypothetical protein
MYSSDGNAVVRSCDGSEDVLAICVNPFLANFMAYHLNERGN